MMLATTRMQFRLCGLFRVVNHKFQLQQRKLCSGQAYINFRNHFHRFYISSDKIRRYSNLAPNVQENNNPSQNPGQEDRSNQRSIPKLMDFPEIMWPSLFNSIRNWMLIQFVIRPYFDQEFYLNDFVFGAQRALKVISSKLMNSDFASLNNLVTKEALNQLKPVVEKLSISQRRQLEVRESDIYLCFPYQVGIMFDYDKELRLQKRWVEITMVFHVLRGLKEMREAEEQIPWSVVTSPDYQDKICVCNYRFIKEFTRGHESDWTVNIVNHFRPMDLLKEFNAP